jgi:hypothetical protein
VWRLVSLARWSSGSTDSINFCYLYLQRPRQELRRPPCRFQLVLLRRSGLRLSLLRLPHSQDLLELVSSTAIWVLMKGH